MPLRLLHWILHCFNCCSSSLILDNSETVRITHEDVDLTLGVPLGVRDVNLGGKDSDNGEEYHSPLAEFKSSGVLGQVQVHILC